MVSFTLLALNFDSISMKLFQSQHIHFSSFGHINLYTIETLTKQIEKEGFKLEEVTTYNLDIELFDPFLFLFLE